MIISIALTDKHKVGVNDSGKFYVETFNKEGKLEQKVVSIKDVPFVRYKFSQFNQEELDYIEKMQGVFKHSSHMVEIDLDKNTEKLLDDLEDKYPNIITFVYVPVTDDVVANGLSEETKELLENIGGAFFDRIMLKDLSTTLHSGAIHRLKKEVSQLSDFQLKEIGVCGGPMSFSGEACLTAVKARELSAEYAENDEVALPSANHESMNTCGCIRYATINKDVDAPPNKTRNTKVTKKQAKTESKPKVKKLNLLKF